MTEASTGSGKTLAFLIPIFEKLIKDTENIESDQIKALIITPTRELAYQIFQVASKMQKALGKVGVKCLFGKMTGDEVSVGKNGKSTNEIESGGQNILVSFMTDCIDNYSWQVSRSTQEQPQGSQRHRVLDHG